MTTATVKKPVVTKEVTKLVTKGTELDLTQILAEAWNQGLPNDILNGW